MYFIVFSDVLSLEINEIEIDYGWREAELDYYEKLFKKHALENKPKILLLIPIKHKIPEAVQCISFDFEVDILDLRHILF